MPWTSTRCSIRASSSATDKRPSTPEAGAPYADRTRVFVGKIDHDDLCYKEFRKHGFIWGGDWKSLKDYQHFEKPVESAHQ